LATSRTRKGAVVGAAVLAVVAALVVAAVLLWPDDTEDPAQAAADRSARAFARAVTAGEPGRAETVQSAAEVESDFATLVAGTPGVDLEVVAGEARLGTDGTATAPLRTTWTLGGASWSSTGTLVLEGEDTDWQPRWSVTALDDRLADGDALTVVSESPERGAILDADGQPLSTPTPVVVVGVEPRRATDVPALVAELERVLGIDGADLAARIEAAPGDQFVEVITLRREDYEPVRDQIRPLPGTVFREEDQALTPSRSFARALLGTVGPATAEQVAESDGRLKEGDLTGQGGVQAAFDEELRGAAGLEVRAGPAGAADAELTVLARVEPVAGADLLTTLDVEVQQAAEAALAGEERVSALVATRVGTGEVLAVANAPTGTPANVALTAQVPPGSTFKVVSTLAYLDHGLDPDSIVPCPATTTAGGREFGNAGGFVLGDVPFHTDFARSCNTAFVDLSAQLGPDDLTVAGAALGLGRDWDLGVGAFSGSIPPTEGPTDTAAASIGQGRLLASPVAMAGVAATVAAGRWVEPVLVVLPDHEAPPPEPLDPARVEALQSMMREVVTDGTGSALAGVPGEPVAAKTGTAEYGTDDPPKAHAWVIGYQGDIAFCVFVEGGESGGGTAAPIAAQFLTALTG
jgi:cell division protein FtsI/penicillin-binding protein 2